MKANATRRCATKHWWNQLCSKALARGTNKSVFVITTGKAEALKLTIFGDAPRSLPASVGDMGPDGLGDALVKDGEIVLLYDGHNHYNGLVLSSIAEALAVVIDEGCSCVWKVGQGMWVWVWVWVVWSVVVLAGVTWF